MPAPIRVGWQIPFLGTTALSADPVGGEHLASRRHCLATFLANERPGKKPAAPSPVPLLFLAKVKKVKK